MEMKKAPSHPTANQSKGNSIKMQPQNEELVAFPLSEAIEKKTRFGINFNYTQTFCYTLWRIKVFKELKCPIHEEQPSKTFGDVFLSGEFNDDIFSVLIKGSRS